MRGGGEGYFWSVCGKGRMRQDGWGNGGGSGGGEVRLMNILDDGLCLVENGTLVVRVMMCLGHIVILWLARLSGRWEFGDRASRD